MTSLQRQRWCGHILNTLVKVRILQYFFYGIHNIVNPSGLNEVRKLESRIGNLIKPKSLPLKPCAVEQVRFNITACAYGMLSLHPVGLIKFLVERGYQQSSVWKQIQRAQVLDRDELLAPRPKWFKSYLTGRRQYVRIGSAYSDTLPITHGVPQGATLSPLLFCIYLNDLPTAPMFC